jgi:hypothetical protein
MRRYWPQLMALVFSLAVFVCSYSFMSAVTRSITTGLDEFGFDTIVVSSRQQPLLNFTQTDAEVRTGLSLEDVDKIKASMGVSARLSMTSRGFAPVGLPGGKDDLMQLWRVDSSFFDVVGMELLRGRNMTRFEVQMNDDVCLVSEKIWLRYYGAREKPIMRIGSHFCTIIGVTSSRETLPNYSVAEAIYVPLHFMSQTNPKNALPITQIFIRTEVGTSAAQRIFALLPANSKKSLLIWTGDEFWALKKRIAWGLQWSVVTGAVAIIAISALAFANCMLVGVTERTGEIGLRRALGATRQTIFRQFLLESVQLSLIGCGCGIGLGLLITKYFLAPMVKASGGLGLEKIFIEPLTLLSALTALLFATLLASWLPAQKAMKMDPAISIRKL